MVDFEYQVNDMQIDMKAQMNGILEHVHVRAERERKKRTFCVKQRAYTANRIIGTHTERERGRGRGREAGT